MANLFFECDAKEHDVVIHIQAHGVLLVLHEADLTVLQVSANTEQLLGVAPEQLLAQPLTALFGTAQVAHLHTMLLLLQPEMRSLMHLQLQPPHPQHPLLAQVQRQPGCILLELEPAPSLLMPWSELVAALRALRTLRSLAGIWPVVAAQVRRLTAFERVTVVQFQPDGSSLVLAEQLHANVASFHPHMVPTRLPPLQRAYYLNAQICVLVDLKTDPVGLISAAHGSPPLAYEYVTLLAPPAAQRSVLQQEGVRAALNIPLFHHGSLWGMICCVDYTQPHPTTFILWTIAELLSEFLSLRLSTLALQPEALTSHLTERQSVLRLGWLQTITAALGEALNLQAVASVIVELATAAIEAQQGYLLLRSADGVSLELANASEHTVEQGHQTDNCPLDAKLPITEAVRCGTALFLAQIPADDPRFRDVTHQAINISTGGVAALPLGDGARGGIIFAFKQAHSFSPAEQEFLLTVAELTLHALDRVRLYDDLQKARAQAEAAVRMRDQFLSVATHELKSPMAALVGHAQLIERRLAKAEHSDAALRVALQQIIPITIEHSALL
ncbi:GAF domain-containing protein [Candidatus Viridilinea mediisalina]|uniref:Phytochrome chromophore attachment site domain-containing protein n=1 Tax=Candidatus Viridilinea mediisalina TaxID=2024553 RepID=A0A2A6RKN0_9CHLR|nr:GAF domain-containing protein [Candidatus Viridilinea mediisalina]PDW03410.1 hypothetical protein CJ255_09145 [Candidatus Viridilinea mediisalina]